MIPSNATENTISLPVQGMTCASCVSHVERALAELAGVSRVAVNLGTGKATVDRDSALVSIEDLRQALEDVGYHVPMSEITLDVRGMTCVSCVARVEGALTDLEGVTRATVNLRMGTARITFVPGVVTVSQMKSAAHELGYEAKEPIAG